MKKISKAVRYRIGPAATNTAPGLQPVKVAILSTGCPFADCGAIVDRLLDADRLVVLLNVLGRRVKVQVQARAVIAAV